MLSGLSSLYGALAERRRRWYEARPEARRRLHQPVISVGSLTMGGSGKTPIVAEVATILASLGERPAVLSRGYLRTTPQDGVVVVSRWGVVEADLGRSGDEPLMLADRLPEASVLVGDDRYLAGRLAETKLGASVHVLDDGFQHLSLARDVDLLVLGDDDLAEARPLPAGRLREPLAAAKRAHALVADAPDLERAHAIADRVGLAEAFYFARQLDPARDTNSGETTLPADARVLAVAGIAKPQAFIDALRSTGYDVVDAMTFRDHHPYSARDVSAIGDRLRAIGASHAVTTEKDWVRLRPHAPLPYPVAWTPLRVSVEPADRFRHWLAERIRSARSHT